MPFIKLQVCTSYCSPSTLHAFLFSGAFFLDGIHLSYVDSYMVGYNLLCRNVPECDFVSPFHFPAELNLYVSPVSEEVLCSVEQL